MKNLTMILAVCTALSTQAYAADQYTPVELEPISYAPASLTVVSPDGTEHTYTQAQLEKFATYSLETTTPWREEAARFEGVMLADILAAHGLSDVPAITVTAENDYRTDLSNELFSSVDVMVAIRVDGRAHSRRERGPIQFVIDDGSFSTSDLTSESNFVWMAQRIEVAQ